LVFVFSGAVRRTPSSLNRPRSPVALLIELRIVLISFDN
jgi:hypothetical protein